MKGDSQAENSLPDESAFQAFLTWLRQRHGLDWSDYRPEYIRRRIRLCVTAAGLSSYPEFIRHLETDPDALRRLREALTVNVTEFFRDGTTFQAFKELVIPELVTEKKKKKAGLIRVWSAGCASGEEPLSLALAFLQVLGPELDRMWLSIYGTDIDEAALAQARRGVYSAKALRALPARDAERYFRLQPEGRYVVSDALRKLVRYQRHDLIHDPPLTHVDVVVCRYVFIYMSRELQERVLRSFHSSLNRTGFLVLGRTESMPPRFLDNLYDCLSPQERIYRKRATEVSE